MRYFFNDSIRLDNSRYSGLRDFTNLTNLTNLKELNSNLRSRSNLEFEALKGLREYSSDLESYIYYAVYRLSDI